MTTTRRRNSQPKYSMEKRLFIIDGLEVRAPESETGSATVRGHAAVFNSDSEDLGGFIERIAPGAFSRSLAANPSTQAFWNHNPDYPLGSTASGGLKLSEDERGLAFELDADRMTDLMRKTVAAGDSKMSFGFRVREDAWEKRSDGMPIRTLHEVDLFEVSLTVIPAYPATEAAFRSLKAWETKAAEIVADEVVEEPKDETRLRLLKRWAEHKSRPTA